LNGANRLNYNSSFRDRQAASAKEGSDAREIPRSRPGRQPRTDTPREEARLKIVEARKARTAEREAARIQREKALEQGAREAERLAEEQRAVRS
jgi:hypothetical protein